MVVGDQPRRWTQSFGPRSRARVRADASTLTPSPSMVGRFRSSALQSVASSSPSRITIRRWTTGLADLAKQLADFGEPLFGVGTARRYLAGSGR